MKIIASGNIERMSPEYIHAEWLSTVGRYPEKSLSLTTAALTLTTDLASP